MDGALECPSLKIPNKVSYAHWISYLQSSDWDWPELPRIQIVRARDATTNGGIPNSPIMADLTYIVMATTPDPDDLLA